jgi:hypothetical protein
MKLTPPKHSVFRRDHQFVSLIQQELNKDDAWMDQLFFLADSI